MAVTTECIAPNEALTAILPGDPVGLGTANNLFGGLAERLIEGDYLAQRGGKVFVEHFIDNDVPDSYIAFLAFHNAHLRSAGTLLQLKLLSLTGIKRPDILTHSAVVKEYYEIKPDSLQGNVDAMEKFMEVEMFYSLFGLITRYPRGSTFTPSPSLPLGSGTIPTLRGFVPFKAFLSVRRSAPGLLQYKICVETDFSAIAETVLVVIGTLIIAILVRRSPLRVPIAIRKLIAKLIPKLIPAF